MENKKALEIHAAVCDVRSAAEEALSAYGQVSIHCAALISSPSAQALLSRYQAEIKAAKTISVEGDVQVSSINGKMHLTPGSAVPEQKTFLMLNGTLDIEPGAGEALKGYAGMMVNGAVDVPESMAGLLGGVSVNGVIRTYPDGAIRLKSTTVLDRTFPLRARQDALYYAASRIIALSGDVDFAKLAEKNVRFTTKKLLIAESLVEAALPLFDEKADIQILPDGCAYLDGDAELNEALVRRHGGKLYIDGDLSILEDGPWLDQVSCLFVNGDLLAARALEDRLNAIDVTCDGLYIVGGTLLMGRAGVALTRAMLEGAEQGLSLAGCANVTVDEDVSAQLLREKLVSVVGCARVACTAEQRAVIESLAQGVALIDSSGRTQDEEETDPNLVKIRSSFYTL